MCSGLLQQDPTIPPEAWFTILSPCFYRAWFCEWNWWRPQPQVTESSGVIADLQCLLSHSVTLVSSKRAPGGDSLRLQMRSISCFSILPPAQKKNDSPRLSPLSLPNSCRSKMPCKDLITDGGDEVVRCGKARLWGGWWGIVGGGRGDEKGRKKSVLWVTLVRFSTANHTQDGFTAHRALLTHFSYCTFHWSISPVPPRSNEGNESMHTTWKFIISWVTHLLHGANELLKSLFMKMDMSRQQGRGIQSQMTPRSTHALLSCAWKTDGSHPLA